MADIAMPTGTPATCPEARFNALFTEYQPRVQGFITQQLPRPDRQLAEDLTAETFLSLWRSIIEPGRLIEDQDPFAILATIAKRRIADHFRVMRNTREVPADTGHWSFANRALVPATGGTLKPLGTDYPGDSDPDPDEALRRARAPRTLVGAR